MHRTTLLSSLFALALGWGLSQSQELAFAHPARLHAASSAGERAWPPRPDRIVALDSEGSSAPASLAPQQLWSAYLVPAGHDLVITDLSLLGEGMALLAPESSGAGFVRRGEAEPTLDSPQDPGAPLGYVVPGGAQVVIQNRSSGVLPLEYALVGYLVRR